LDFICAQSVFPEEGKLLLLPTGGRGGKDLKRGGLPLISAKKGDQGLCSRGKEIEGEVFLQNRGMGEAISTPMGGKGEPFPRRKRYTSESERGTEEGASLRGG